MRHDNTVLVVEHQMDVVKCADWVIDLGPEGGEAGGYIVAEGTPDEVARSHTHTGRYLAYALDGGQPPAEPASRAAARPRTA